MTATELHRSFRFGMDKMDNINYPNFLPEEIDLLLNQSQDRIVKQRYGRNNFKRLGFEEDEKRAEDLREVLKTITSPLTQGISDSPDYYSGYITLQEDHWFIVWDRAILYCESCDQNRSVKVYATETPGGLEITVPGHYVEVKPTTHNELTKVLQDDFKAPDYDKILRVLYQDRIDLLYPEGCNVAYYSYRYIKKLDRISLSGNITCELSDHMHQEVVDMAIQIALEGIEAKRQNSFDKIINTNE